MAFRLGGGALALLLLTARVSAGGEARRHPVVEVRNPDGTVYGSLRLSETGETLLMSWQGQERPFGECGDEVRDEVAGHGATAITYVRNCGATVDFATHLAVQTVAGREVVAVFEGRPRVALKWTDSSLQVTTSPIASESVFKRIETTGGGLKITYAASGPAEAPSQYVDYASYNYGAMGRAAGLPMEMLQRVAGWSQEASGLYRPEWGTWWGEYPYGDDPRGREMVMGGIKYYECEYRGGKGCGQK